MTVGELYDMFGAIKSLEGDLIRLMDTQRKTTYGEDGENVKVIVQRVQNTKDELDRIRNQPLLHVIRVNGPNGERFDQEGFASGHEKQNVADIGSTFVHAINLIMQERKRQDEIHGGPDHDDMHDATDFKSFIQDKIDKQWPRMDQKYTKEMFVKVAALAVAALEAMERAEINGRCSENDQHRC